MNNREIDDLERRKSNLTELDLSRITEAFDKAQQRLFETIGYDISTPEARTAIRQDHEFVRSTREAKTAIVTSFLISVGGLIATAFYSLFGKSS